MTDQPQFPREFPGVHYYGPEEEEAVLRVIRNRSPFRYYGASFLHEAENLEREFSARLGRKYAQAVCSGTNGLAAALAALGVGPGQEVLVPGFLWVATVGTVVRAGAIPVLVEIGDDFNLCPEDLARKITPRSTVVLPVHMCGVPADMPAILEVARRHNLRVLEDCAQANGATLHGRPAGSFGDLAMFSFQMNKMITAGEGGIVVSDDPALIDRVNAAHDLGVPWTAGMPDDTKNVHLWGAGARMSELAAAVLRAQLGKLDAILAAMRAAKARIKARLADLPGLVWRRIDDPAGEAGAFVVATCESSGKAAELARHAAELGVPCANHLPNYGLHVYYNIRALVDKAGNSPDGFPWTHPANRGSVYSYAKGALPRTDELLDRSLLFAIPSRMTREQEDRIVALFREAHARTFQPAHAR